MEEILLVSIVNHTVESAIMLTRICPIVFPPLGLKFPSDKEDFLVEVCILLSLVIFEPCRRGAKVKNKCNDKSYETIL